MHDYEKIVSGKLLTLQNEGYTHNIFGNIFPEDLRQYREKLTSTFGIDGVFAFWKINIRILLQSNFDLGFKAVIVCVHVSKLDKSFAGRMIDKNFMNDLPKGTDPCGANGEFHMFLIDGPIFKSPVQYSAGAYYYKELKDPSGQLGPAAHLQTNMGF